MTSSDSPTLRRPATIAVAVAIVGRVSLLLVDHGPWGKLSAETGTMAEVGRTAGIAAAAGAVITETARSKAALLTR
jgi:ABC-type Co2+ transport system permease subunit